MRCVRSRFILVRYGSEVRYLPRCPPQGWSPQNMPLWSISIPSSPPTFLLFHRAGCRLIVSPWVVHLHFSILMRPRPHLQMPVPRTSVTVQSADDTMMYYESTNGRKGCDLHMRHRTSKSARGFVGDPPKSCCRGRSMTPPERVAPRARKDRNWALGSTLQTIMTEDRWNRPASLWESS